MGILNTTETRISLGHNRAPRFTILKGKPMLDHLKRLGIFSVVARTGSFSMASVELGMTPANVSQQIKKLEDWLGVTLIFRSTRHVALSPEGKNLLPFANEVLQSAEAGFRQLGDNENQKGKLTILFPSFLIGSDIHSSINSFASEHPSVLIKLIYQDSFANIIENGIDLGSGPIKLLARGATH